MIYLHGGVSREHFIEDYKEMMRESPFLEYAEKYNWIALLPMGNIETAWWSETGLNNISYQIRYLKERYNIDDDRVYLTGFSDGGSAAYHFSMLKPDDFAAFYPLSGNMLVGSAVTGVPVYTGNMSNRYVRAVNTDLDGLYPATRMRLMVELAQKMGADIFYREYWGIGHNYEYGREDLPLMFEDMKRQARNMFQPSIYCETADERWGRCDWLEILKIDTLRVAEDWHNHLTLSLPDDRVLFGFIDEREYEGYGIKIARVNEGSVSAEIGLQQGDIIVAMDGTKTEEISELLGIRDTKKRGDAFTLTVLREEQELVLSGSFPPVQYVEVFDNSTQSGGVRGFYRANTFHIESSRVSRIAVYLHPEMINYHIPVIIIVNENELFNKTMEIDRDFMTGNYKRNRDRSALWTNRIVIDIPQSP